jgi:hypothetical protein
MIDRSAEPRSAENLPAQPAIQAAPVTPADLKMSRLVQPLFIIGLAGRHYRFLLQARNLKTGTSHARIHSSVSSRLPSPTHSAAGGNDMSDEPTTDKAMFSLRIVAAAMLVGVVALWVVVLVISRSVPDHPELTGLLSTALLIFAVIATLLPILLYRPMVDKTRQEIADAPAQADPAGIAMQHLQVHTLISLALAEGLGLLAAVVYLLTRYQSAMLMAALGIILIVRQFPTRGQLERLLARARETESTTGNRG